MDTLTIVVLALAGAAIRPTTAFLLKEQADGGPLGAISGIVLAGVATLGATLADVGNIADDWKTVVGGFLTAVVAAGGTAAQTWAGRAVQWIHERTDHWLGLGGGQASPGQGNAA